MPSIHRFTVEIHDESDWIVWEPSNIEQALAIAYPESYQDGAFRVDVDFEDRVVI